MADHLVQRVDGKRSGPTRRSLLAGGVTGTIAGAVAGTAGLAVGTAALPAQVARATTTGNPRPALAVVYSADCPDSVRTAADGLYTLQCPGSGDQATINAAISAVAAVGQTYSGNGTSGGTGTPPSGGGGSVLLLGYTFNISAPIVLQSWVELRGGFGRAATRINAQSSFSGGQLIGLAHPWTEQTTVRDLYLFGNKAAVTAHGLYYVGQVDQVPYSYADPKHSVMDLVVHDAGGDGVFIDTAVRATRLRGIRVERAGHYGFHFTAPDSFISDCESGGSAAEGFYIGGTNCQYENCKSWFAHTHGYTVQATRVQIVNSLAQDCYQHGWNLPWGKASIVGCHADSNGYNGTGYGFAIGSVGYLTVRDCQSYDRNTNPHQQYGVHFSAKPIYSSMEVVTYNNLDGSFWDNSGAYTSDPNSQFLIRGN
jgi:hypothetical protein